MKIAVVKMWASPSTLHLSLCYGPESDKWVRFANVRVPLDEIPTEDLRNILERDQAARQEDDVPLF